MLGRRRPKTPWKWGDLAQSILHEICAIIEYDSNRKRT